MTPARILIISNGHLCRNPRVLKEATALGQAGYDVTVLTIRNHRPSETIDRDLMRTAPFRRETVDILPGYDAGAATVLWRRGVAWAARRACGSLGWQSIHALGPASALLARARRLPADLVITHNEVPHWVGTRLLATGRRVCADLEDWHSEDLLPESRGGRPVALLRRIESILLHDAVHTTTTSHALAGALFTRYGGRQAAVITNSFPLQSRPPLDQPEGPPAFFWFSQTLGPGRGLEEFLAAWSRTSHPSRVVLLGTPTPGYDQRLLALLPPERRSQVAFLALVPPDDLPALIAGHHVGLALEQGDIPSRNLTITNKILQYLNAGLAIVASDTAGQREVLAHDPTAGVIVDVQDPAAFTRALDGLLADPVALARRRQAARGLAERIYCWDREGPRRVALIADALRDTSEPATR
ncbi:hypothetical protein Verru16b_02826 [Lacunisphaera limnophila]|uniref:Uncharacterized protein n=1 Tax=Lacunisphaera limnophila TaxID=1838286 RepID=A0A1D8AXW8_9BACT|nr:glycosyltransferase [Lacunisphaera limnophila]AOS45739.1 hypothetical protein Verru16b_02826 [Lacunisphaera limnophila]